MASSARTPLSDLPKGHEFPRADFALTREEVSRYLDAVGEDNDLYVERAFVPPLALVARTLAALQEVMELPAGTLHTGQEVELRAAVPIGAEVTVAGRVAQRSERAGLVISILEFDLSTAGASEPAVRARTTVMAPAGGAS